MLSVSGDGEGFHTLVVLSEVDGDVKIRIAKAAKAF